MNKIRVGVLRGGQGNHYDQSLRTGAAVLAHLPQDIYEVQDIFISKDGTWHKAGLPIAPSDAILHFDVVFNALHGYYGEDGKIQQFLEMHKVPFTGSGSFSSAVGMNKALTKETLKREGIKTPYFQMVDKTPHENLTNLFKVFSPPVSVKPVSRSSQDSALVQTPKALLEAVEKMLGHYDSIMIEEHIPGVAASVGVIDGYRGSSFYSLPAVEGGMTVPGNFSSDTKRELEDLAQKVHKALGLRHYSRTDFVVSPRRGIFVLETSTQPDFTEGSSLAKALESVGAATGHFLDHVVQLALGRK